LSNTDKLTKTSKDKIQKMEKLKTEDKSALIRNIVNDKETVASFDYVDGKGRESHRLVRVDSPIADEKGNWTFYNYSDNQGQKGGIRSFKGGRISNFMIID
jgi:predicted DNA-binding transcriptional regulator YafY